MIKPSQLRRLISDTLDIILPKMKSPEAIELLMMTAAQESFCGRYLQQQGCGVALGIFQMEPPTYHDLFDKLIRTHKDINDIVSNTFKVSKETFHISLMGNIPYQIVLARLQYYRFPESIPNQTNYIDINEWEVALARYYKKYWNTYLGVATIKETLRNYDKYAK